MLECSHSHGSHSPVTGLGGTLGDCDHRARFYHERQGDAEIARILISRCIDTAGRKALDFTLGKTPQEGVRPEEQRGRRRGNADRRGPDQEVRNSC